MNINNDNNKILVIHGPNMNLIGHQIIYKSSNITLDKINKHLRKTSNSFNYKLKIYQTNSESKAVDIIQRNRNKVFNIILFPRTWQQSGHALKDILSILMIPLTTISTGEDVCLLKGSFNIHENDICKSIDKAFLNISKN